MRIPSLHILCPDEPQRNDTVSLFMFAADTDLEWFVFSLTAGRAVRTLHAILVPSGECQLCGREGQRFHTELRRHPL